MLDNNFCFNLISLDLSLCPPQSVVPCPIVPSSRLQIRSQFVARTTRNSRSRLNKFLGLLSLIVTPFRSSPPRLLVSSSFRDVLALAYYCLINCMLGYFGLLASLHFNAERRRTKSKLTNEEIKALIKSSRVAQTNKGQRKVIPLPVFRRPLSAPATPLRVCCLILEPCGVAHTDVLSVISAFVKEYKAFLEIWRHGYREALAAAKAAKALRGSRSPRSPLDKFMLAEPPMLVHRTTGPGSNTDTF